MPLKTINGIFLPANGFLDETEKGDVVGVGGWIGNYASWNYFERRWFELLPSEAKGDFHYTDYWHDPKYWSAKWSHSKRVEFMQQLAELIVEHTSLGLGILVSKAEYEETIPEEDKHEVKEAVYFCLAHCLRLLIEHFDTMPGQPPKPLSFMHDRKTGKHEWIGGWYTFVRNRFQHKNILGDLSFGTRAEEPGLQAADLLMGELRRYREGHESKIIDIFRQKNNVLVGRPTKDELRELVRKAYEMMQ